MTDQSRMDLKTFVTETLTQIIDGIAAAKEKVDQADTSAKINPTEPHEAYSRGTDVEFDVAVMVSGAAGKSGEAGLRVAGVSIGGGKHAGTSNETVSRVRFSIPVSFPHTPEDRLPGHSGGRSIGR